MGLKKKKKKCVDLDLAGIAGADSWISTVHAPKPINKRNLGTFGQSGLVYKTWPT